MKNLLGIFLFLCLPSLALASAQYERAIDLNGIDATQAVLLTVPEEVTLYNDLSSLRILKNGEVIPLTTSPSQQGQFGGVIASSTLCSIEGAGRTEALHDGDTTTSVRPDPLQNPKICTLEIVFSIPIRVHGIAVDADQRFRKLAISARISIEKYVQLRDIEWGTAMNFSSVVTNGIKLSMEYDIVPNLHELTLLGEIPARILFEADPNATYVLVYGDENPPKLPPASDALFAIGSTRFVSLGSEKIREEDSDQDGILAARDNCPFVVNPDQRDSDADSVGDPCDNAPGVTNAPQFDKDHDGVGDGQDNCPGVFNPDQRDEDLNGIGYACDDKDGDGVMNGKDNCAGLSNRDQQDLDGNGIGDACESDRDSDVVSDAEDNCRGTPNPEQEDRDEDDIGDACDSCPTIKNSDQDDRNENGIGDACESAIQDPDADNINNDRDNCPTVPNTDQLDADADGKGDLCDNCPTLQNPDQRDSDKNGQGDVCTDSDGDGFLPHIDNCPSIANADQADKDNDGSGDACEDDDGDGIANANDNCKYKSNRDQADQDADGIGNTCDEQDSRFSEQHPWVMWIGMSFIVLVLLSLAIGMIVRIRKDQDRET